MKKEIGSVPRVKGHSRDVPQVKHKVICCPHDGAGSSPGHDLRLSPRRTLHLWALEAQGVQRLGLSHGRQPRRQKLPCCLPKSTPPQASELHGCGHRWGFLCDALARKRSRYAIVSRQATGSFLEDSALLLGNLGKCWFSAAMRNCEQELAIQARCLDTGADRKRMRPTHIKGRHNSHDLICLIEVHYGLGQPRSFAWQEQPASPSDRSL